jgi:hypothetical protein
MPRRPGESAGAGPDLPTVDVSSSLARLPGLDTAALRAEWERLHRRPPPHDLTRDLLLRGIAHRLQEQAFGGLPPATVRRLETIHAPTTARTPTTATRTRREKAGRPKPGTVLVRGWRGQTHTVVVRDGGFEYRGRLHRSLSIVAREITGAHWSGPRFFRLAGKGVSLRAGQGVGSGA